MNASLAYGWRVAVGLLALMQGPGALVGSTLEEFTRAFHAELRRWSKFGSETGLKLD